MILFFDTETTGLVNNKLPYTDASQPHLVQLSLLLTEDDGTERASSSLIIRPDRYQIPEAASKVHGISQELAMRAGVSLMFAAASFSNFAKLATKHVAHNIAFDVLVMQSAFHRCVKEPMALDPECTMALASPILNLPPTDRMKRAGFTKNKPPNLAECVKFFFDENLEGAHDAMIDVRACARVYFAIRDFKAEAAMFDGLVAKNLEEQGKPVEVPVGG